MVVFRIEQEVAFSSVRRCSWTLVDFVRGATTQAADELSQSYDDPSAAMDDDVIDYEPPFLSRSRII